LKLQLDKFQVKVPVSGVITAQNLEKGELAGPGMAVFTVAKMEAVTHTVYIPKRVF